MKIVSINTSEKKGTPKTEVEKAVLKADHGLVGDAHAAPGDRQVSLLSDKAVKEFEKNPKLKKGCLKHGIFGENIRTSGIDYTKIKIGGKLEIGEVILEISKIGKECHKPCFIYSEVGDCIMPTQGVFAKVMHGGEIKKGDAISIK